MSGLIDIWTSELKKLRGDNKGPTHSSSPSEPVSPNQANHHSIWSHPLLRRLNSPSLAFPVSSDASKLSNSFELQMATMVNIWFRELMKHRQMIQLEKTTTKKSSLIFKSRAAQQLEEESRTSCSKSASTLPENQMSEETIFWLMDRFAPC
ncbi:hypothetical protein L1987_19418 [Smallanthus sonchifolius]|uniref:Uncharacterized protein n=1 Tax=Smallanthus sonchifolius TaxID=185202 RepID=A0ACB9IQ69_9ASTR|nr:hypothetical protein L1987_19418 [Smallanthus sonchifolius]